MSIIGSIVGGITGANAASDASSALQKGAKQAQDTIAQGQNAAEDFLTSEWSGNKQNQQPYLDLGSTSANSLRNLLSKGFTAPTLADVENTPGYQFTLEQGTRALDENAAANGTLNSGNTGVALERYGQGLAETTYNDAYNRALSTYMANLQGLMGGSQLGEAATSTLGYQGNQAAGLNTNIELGGSEAQAQQINNAAAARASGYLGRNQAWQGMIGGLTGEEQNIAGAMPHMPDWLSAVAMA